MLQTIRDRITGKFAIMILVLIAMPFMFFGVANYNFLGDSYAAKVDGVEITTFDVEREFRNQLQQNPQWNELPVQFQQGMRQRALDRLILQTLVDQFIVSNGFRVSDEMITTLIHRTPSFQVDGEFSKETYYSFLEVRGMTTGQFEQIQRNGIRLNQLERAIAATAFVTPSEYRRHLNLYGEQREVAVATFELSDIVREIEVSEEEILAYYDERPNDFQSEESVDIEYIEIRRDLLALETELTEEELQAYYETTTSRYLQDEQRQARHILIPFDDDEEAARDQAAGLTARANAGEPFEDLARTYSMDGGTSSQGGDLGMVVQSQMPGALGSAIFSMREGEVQGPVRSEFGYHVIRLDVIQDGGALPLDQVRGELERELRDQKSEIAFRALERSLSDALFDLMDMPTMGETTGLETKTASNFTRFGGEPFGTNQSVIDAVFDDSVLNGGQISDIIEIDANRSAVFRVGEYREAKRKPLEDVRIQISTAITGERAKAMVRERSEALQAALHAGAEFSQAAADVGAAISPASVVGRADQEMDRRVLDAAFAVKKPTGDLPRIGTAETLIGDPAVFVITASAPGRPESIPLADRDARKNDLAMDSGSADYNAFIRDLERNADVVKSEAALAEPVFQ